MDFIEEKTPAGYSIKVLYKNWKFLAFDKRGKSIYKEGNSESLLHDIPLIIFVGTTFRIKEEHDRAFYLLKIKNNSIILPYFDKDTEKTKYLFIPTEQKIDLLPARIMMVANATEMVREYDISYRPDYIVVGERVNENDVIIITNRYKVRNVIYIREEKVSDIESDDDRIVNLNVMSTNPVFLARVHLRNMELSKVNQLLLDFDLSLLDAEYIVRFIESTLKENEDPSIKVNRSMLLDLHNSFTFYLYLLQRNDEKVKEIVNSLDDFKKFTPFRTLITKAKSIFPDQEDQFLFTEYENWVVERYEELKNKKDQD